ncbi:Protein CBG04609 [Caenorhabditis briggsae]|uniref:Protein CBG04609 n=1 Tax=Caenorhabditis briggsae TaxID=6238 RepID=A8WY19_CAEBR|nr:Protein CBG04609 [Caenorhabditis briggsae]CAP25279.2 Protein CBG04609 [Caenorhabditis briggsae]
MIFLILFLLLFSAISPDNECPYRYKFYANTAICYHLSDDFYDFNGAVRYCESTGGKLVSLIQGERAGIANLTSHLLVQPWVASKRNTTTGIFYNLDHSVFISEQWAQGEPNPANGDCVTFKGVSSNFGLQTTQCYQQQYAFCKIVPDLCNGGIQNGTFGSIQSPQYPNQYYNKLMCLYYIYAPQGFRVNIYFPQIQTEKNYDFIEIYEKNSTLYPDRIVGLSGNITDYTYQSNSSFLLVGFRTNYVFTDIGFHATWNVERIQPPIISNTTNYGELTSPNYPEDYDTFDKQLYYIQVVEGGRINVTIDDFFTQETFDYLDIFDSSNQSSKVVRLSGNSVAPWSWLSTSSVVLLKFVSDGSYQYRGWHLTWNMI